VDVEGGLGRGVVGHGDFLTSDGMEVASSQAGGAVPECLACEGVRR
jgi:hypothetical protein